MIRVRPALRRIARRATAFAFAATLFGAGGCAVRTASRSPWDAETEIILRSPNFETAVVHAVGTASCDYVLFMVPLCANQSIATRAWNDMTRQANVDGQAAQYVNITVDDVVRWNALGLWFRQVYAVSADVIVYHDVRPEPGPSASPAARRRPGGPRVGRARDRATGAPHER